MVSKAKLRSSGVRLIKTAVFLDSRHTFPVFQVMGYDIADISFPDPPLAPTASTRDNQQPKTKTPPPAPAIVSFSKPDLPVKSPATPPPKNSPPPASRRLSVRDAAQ